MQKITFDFNNMLDHSIGGLHGVTPSDMQELSGRIKDAHEHLTGLMASPVARKTLSLEWVELPLQGEKMIDEVRSLAKEIAAKFDNVVSLGIGGSYLGLKAAQDALCAPYYNEFKALRKGRPRIYFEGNNLDPETLRALLKNLDPKKTFVIVISKSGETTETKAALMVIEAWLKKHVGAKFGRRILAITDPTSGSLRKKVDQEQAKDTLSFRSLPLLKGVGGRFSELNIGLLHLALAGVDIARIFEGALAMRERCLSPDLAGNPAYMYAALHTILYRKKGKSIAIVMPFSEALKSTADWYVQLLAESLGKKYARKIEIANDGTEAWRADASKVVNVGRTPVACRGTNDLHSIQQNNIEGENNKAVTFIRVKKFARDLKIPGGKDILSGRSYSGLLELAQEATEWALARESRPSCTITLPEISPYYWGGLLFFFEMATAFEGELLGVNAFDQPGVEGYKHYMYFKLGKPGLPEATIKEIKDNPLIKDQRYIL